MKKYVQNGVIALALLGATGVQAAAKMPPLPMKKLQEMKAYQTQIQAALKTATPQQADKLLIQYAKKTSRLLNEISYADGEFLSDVLLYHVDFAKNDENRVIYKSAALKAREKTLAKYGLKYQYNGPSKNDYLTLEEMHYSRLFGKKVSPAVKAYLDLRDTFAKEEMFNDYEMVMDYDRLGERTLAWERYLNKFGETTPLLNHAKCEYIVHQSAFLTGRYAGIGITGITLNGDYDSNDKKEKMKPYVRGAWADYQKKYPQSASSLLIAKMPKKPPFQAPAEKIVADYHKRVGLNKLTPKVCETLWF